MSSRPIVQTLLMYGNFRMFVSVTSLATGNRNVAINCNVVVLAPHVKSSWRLYLAMRRKQNRNVPVQHKLRAVHELLG